MYEILENLNNLMIQNIYIAPLIAFIAGVLVAFSPCSLSSLPLLIVYVSKNDKKKIQLLPYMEVLVKKNVL